MKTLLKRLFPDTHPLRLLGHRFQNGVHAALAGYPSKKLVVIGVTGTDGKTTTVAMLTHIALATGLRTGAVSTAFFQIGEMRLPNPTQKTSVDGKSLQSFLRRLVREGITHVVVEASSHGLMQGRLAGIRPHVAAVTNVTMEHLDYHGTMENYIDAKAMLFRSMKGKGTKVLNADDKTFDIYSAIPSDHCIDYSPSKQISDAKSDGTSVSCVMTFGDDNVSVALPMPGLFNLENALCAISCAQALGIDPRTAADALKNFRGAGGRMENVDAGQPFRVFVDFTVTPAAYERTLRSARQLASGKVLVLTGSCGDRMKEKRPVVGKLCATMADVTVVTNEDPYTEDPEAIIDDVLSGVPKDIPLFKTVGAVTEHQPEKFCVRISDRLEAIRFILRQAKAGDVVLFCGKGSDVTMMTAKGQIPWVEKDIVTSELLRLSGDGEEKAQ